MQINGAPDLGCDRAAKGGAVDCDQARGRFGDVVAADEAEVAQAVKQAAADRTPLEIMQKGSPGQSRCLHSWLGGIPAADGPSRQSSLKAAAQKEATNWSASGWGHFKDKLTEWMSSWVWEACTRPSALWLASGTWSNLEPSAPASRYSPCQALLLLSQLWAWMARNPKALARNGSHSSTIQPHRNLRQIQICTSNLIQS